jgi:methyltransferase family protein
LYSGYRGEEYFQERHRAEPWYSRRVNDGIASDPEEIQTRNSAMEAFLRPHINFDELNAVLDYGGDKGQFMPAMVGRQKFVFELSDAQPVEGVTRIASEAELDGRHFDLTLLLGVLEHCSEPLSVLLKVRALTQGSNSHIAIGVPYEWYKLDGVGTGRLYSWYLDTLLKSGPLMKLVDFYSTAFRVRSCRIPPLGILKCHEHLNFFNEQSMTALLHRAGMDLAACSITQTCTYPARTFSLNVLAKPVN